MERASARGEDALPSVNQRYALRTFIRAAQAAHT